MEGRERGQTGPRSRSLASLRVAITRTEEDARGLARALRARGAEVAIHPAIRRAPPSDPRALEGALKRLLQGDYEGVLFTSPASVHVLRGRLGEAPFPAEIFGAVGPGTMAALEDWGKGPTLMGPRHDGVSLAETFLSEFGERLVGMRFLQPRAEEGREELSRILEAAGARVEVVPAYRTLAREAAELAPLCRRLRRGDLDAVVFASPSAVRAVRLACGAGFLGEALGLAIGETTAEALRRAGARRVAAAEEATDAALVEALERRF